MSASKTDNDETKEVKRTLRCPGCGTPPSEHDCEIPNHFCEGKEKSSPHRQSETIPEVQDVDTKICKLEEELASLNNQEEQQAKERRVVNLQRHGNEKLASLEAARHSSNYPLSANADPATLTELKKHVIQTPLDGILRPLQHLQHSSSQASMTQHFPQPFLESSC